MATATISSDDTRRLLILLAEAKARGIAVPNVPAELLGNSLFKKENTRDVWLTPNGFFPSIFGKHYIPNDKQRAFIESRRRYAVFSGGRGSGKALALDTPILTANRGWLTMGDVQVGDTVFGDDGRPTKVITKSPIMLNHTCYKVNFSDGSVIVADAEHLWYTQNKKERNGEITSGGKVRTTADMLRDVTIGKSKELNYSIRTCSPLQYDDADLLIHPYILGVWLGDETNTGSGFITDDEIISMGILNNKHIPEIYLHASVEQRLALLQGLMDTSGYVDVDGHCEFTSSKKELFDGVLDLCLGLGIKATGTVNRATLYGKDCGERYKIYINTSLPIFRLTRKLNRLFSTSKQADENQQRFITSIEPTASVPVQCIGVDNENHLYLAGKTLIATHNTAGGAQKALLKISQGQSGAVLNPDFENLVYSTWAELRQWIPWNAVVPEHRYRKNATWQPTKPFFLAFVNGAKMYVKGLKSPDGARGPNLNWLWYDEAGRDEVGTSWFLAIASIRIGENPQAWATMTAKPTTHWAYKFFVEQDFSEEAIALFEDAGLKRDELVDVFYASTEENRLNLDPAFYASLVASYKDPALRKRELEGIFADSGQKFADVSKLKLVTELPDDVVITKWARYWDMAGTEKKVGNNPDESVGTLAGIAQVKGSVNKYIIENQVGGWLSWARLKNQIAETAIADGQHVTVVIEQEPGSGGKNQVAEIQDFFKNHPKYPQLKYWNVVSQRPTDRVGEFNAWWSYAEDGMVYVKRDDSWNKQFYDQVSSFPSKYVHDDRVTSVNGVMRWLSPLYKVWKNYEFVSV